MGKAKKIIKKIVPKEIVKPFVDASPPPVAAVVAPPPPPPAPEPAPAPKPVAKAAPVEAAKAAPVEVAKAAEPAASPAVSDPAPVTDAPQETEDMQQTVMRKKKGRKKTILTGSAGLGGDPTTYQSMLS